MKKSFFSITLAVITLFSCKKKDVEPQNECIVPPNPIVKPTSTSYFPMTIGSIWVYESFKIDSTGVETSLGNDTTEVVGDSIVNGQKFMVFTGFGINSSSQKTLLRDSSGHILNENGTIRYDFTDFTTIDTGPYQFIPTWIRSFQLIDDTNTPFIVPAGIFYTVNFFMTLSESDGSPIDNCGNLTYSQNDRFAQNVGRVMMNFAYFSDVQLCANREKRLIYYDITP